MAIAGRSAGALSVGGAAAVAAAAAAGFVVVVAGVGLATRVAGLAPPPPASPAGLALHALALGAGAAAALLALRLRVEGPLRVHLGLAAGPVAAWLAAFGAGLALQLPLAALGGLVEQVAPLAPEMRAHLARLVRPAGPLEGVVHVLALVVVPPVAEELVFRGALLRGLVGPGAPRARAIAAALATSALFAVAHGPPAAVAVAFVAALVLAVVVLRGGALGPAIALHAGVNAAPFVAAAAGWSALGLDAAAPAATVPAAAWGPGAVVGALLAALAAEAQRRAARPPRPLR